MVGHNNIELVEANMTKDQTCFNGLAEQEFDYIMHTACPFMEGVDVDDN